MLCGSAIQTILPNRLKQTIFNYFMRFPAPVRSLVRTVSCDLNSYYVDLIKKLFPNAKIIIDRFHIVQMLNRAVNSTRTDLMNRFDNNSKNYKLFKRNWKLFLKRYDDLMAWLSASRQIKWYVLWVPLNSSKHRWSGKKLKLFRNSQRVESSVRLTVEAETPSSNAIVQDPLS